MTKWLSITLSTVCSNISYGFTASANFRVNGPKFLRITDIVPKSIDWESVPFCQADEKIIDKYRLKNGDIVIARTGANTGFNKTIKNLERDAIFASYLIRYEVDREKANAFYVGYAIQSPQWYDYIDAIAGGSAQPGANASQLGSFSFLFFCLRPEGNRIPLFAYSPAWTIKSTCCIARTKPSKPWVKHFSGNGLLRMPRKVG